MSNEHYCFLASDIEPNLIENIINIQKNFKKQTTM